MEKSESIKEIAGALWAFQGEVGNVSKDGVNPFFKSKYATFENVIATIKAPLEKRGLSYAQFPDADGLYTLMMHKSGEWIGAHAALELKGHTPQDQGSAITYMRRYALSAALGLATEDDDDGNAASKTKPIFVVRDNSGGYSRQTEEQVGARSDGYDKAVGKVERPKVVAGPVNAKKKLIADLLVDTSKDPLVALETKAQFEEQCRLATGLELVEENYDAIIEQLQAVKHLNEI